MKSKILIVEDEENIAKAEGIILKEHDIFYAKDGEEAILEAKRIIPDVIILDLMLPKREGYDVCYTLRQYPELSKVKIIMVTAKDQAIDEDKGMLIGADDYIMKPFEPEELRHVVFQVLNKND